MQSILKTLVVVILFSNALACKTSPDLKEIQTPVYGGLVLGQTSSFNIQVLNDLASTGKISFTNSNRFPYFTINDNSYPGFENFYLFPNLHFEDSVITAISYYVYVKETIPQEAINDPSLLMDAAKDIPGADMSFITDRYKREEDFFNQILNDFTLTKITDAVSKVQYPKYESGNYNRNSIIAEFLQKQIEVKYSQSPTIEKTGDPANIKSTFYMSRIWNTDNIEIKLLTQRTPVLSNNSSDGFITVLIYKFNSRVREKYKFSSQKNSNTF